MHVQESGWEGGELECGRPCGAACKSLNSAAKLCPVRRGHGLHCILTEGPRVARPIGHEIEIIPTQDPATTFILKQDLCISLCTHMHM